MNKCLLVIFILTIVNCCSGTEQENKEYPPYDGWYNNRGNPSSGAIASHLSRIVFPFYEDGTAAPSGVKRPNPRELSNILTSGNSGLPSNDNKTAFFAFFEVVLCFLGQQIFDEIVDSNRHVCPMENMDIALPLYDPYFHSNITHSIPYHRSSYDMANVGCNRPRDQLNDVTSFLDGSSIYGADKIWANQLRLFKTNCKNRKNNIFSSVSDSKDCRGELASHFDEGKLPNLNKIGLPLFNPAIPRDRVIKSSQRFLMVGNRFGNENPFLLSLQVLWFRHHNFLAKQLRNQQPSWNDEKVFNEARIRNVATYQKIVMYDWLPLLLGCSISDIQHKTCTFVPAYQGYNPSTPVGIGNIFQTAAKPYIYSLLPTGVFRRNRNCTFRSTSEVTSGNDRDFMWSHVGKKALRICNTYWTSDEALRETDIDEILLGMASQISERGDHVINSDWRNFYHGPLHFTRRDLVAITIQQGRDHGLPDYNTARINLGLSRKNDFYEIVNSSTNAKLLKDFQNIHENHLDKIDIFIGGLMESSNGEIGELFHKVFNDQFLKLRDGDRFWFENIKNGLLNSSEIESILNTSIRDVILRTNPHLSDDDIQENPFNWNIAYDNKLFCPQPFQVKESDLESCVPLHTVDYFHSSEIPFIFSFVGFGIFLIVIFIFMRTQVYLKLRKIKLKKRQNNLFRSENNIDIIEAKEFLGKKKQSVKIHLTKNSIEVTSKKMRRIILFSIYTHVEIWTSNSSSVFVKTHEDNYDLVLSFVDKKQRNVFVFKLINYLKLHHNISVTENIFKEKNLLKLANTKEKRDQKLKNFFKTALAISMDMKDNGENYQLPQNINELVSIKLSKPEFADYIQMKETSQFVEFVFSEIDTDDDGFITFEEFLKMSVTFMKGTVEDKFRFMFNIYDLNKTGYLEINQFKLMIRSMITSLNTTINFEIVEEIIENIIQENLFKNNLDFDDFKSVMNQYDNYFNQSTLSVNERSRMKTKLEKHSLLLRTYINTQTINKNVNQNATEKSFIVHVKKFLKIYWKLFWIRLKHFVQYYYLQIFWLSLYLWITLGVFLYSFNAVTSNQPSGLYVMGGYWIALARASAGALMFNMSTILLTMCRNIITFLRETFLNKYVPFDSAVAFHKFLGWLSLCFTAVHIIGHGVNFYSITTQSPSDLNCLFPDIWYASDYLPTFVFWLFQTLTGITGVILTLVFIVMYVFALEFSRRHIFIWFQWTHLIGYISIYFFTIFHGSGMLIQLPGFYLYFLVPAILFIFDKLYSLSRNRTEIQVIKAVMLPSQVTCLEFKRPHYFNYKAGQWVRIACLDISPNEFHPFTLSSAPCENTLKLHIRATGSWTNRIRKIYDPAKLNGSPYPKIFLDGPFGEGHQDWYKYDVAILVGGGIGVTPFAAILKDLVHVAQTGQFIQCKKIIFMWVTRDQKQYEWLIDIIQETEQKDINNMLETNIYITQLSSNFDLRTTMLYICEEKFKKLQGKSMFTGLKASTNFGRPNFEQIFTSLKERYYTVKKFGVFSCGPPPMTKNVQKSCAKLNNQKGSMFYHHFENF